MGCQVHRPVGERAEPVGGGRAAVSAAAGGGRRRGAANLAPAGSGRRRLLPRLCAVAVRSGGLRPLLGRGPAGAAAREGCRRATVVQGCSGPAGCGGGLAGCGLGSRLMRRRSASVVLPGPVLAHRHRQRLAAAARECSAAGVREASWSRWRSRSESDRVAAQSLRM